MVVQDLIDLVLVYGDPSQPSWTALEHEGRTVSNHQLRDATMRAANRLSVLDGPLVVCTPDPIAHTIAGFGVIAAGGVAMLVDPRLPDEVVTKAAGRAGSTAIIGRRLPGMVQLEPDELTERSPIAPCRHPSDAIATILLTSGSTGEQKLVQRQRGADLHAAMNLNLSNVPLVPGDRYWISGPHTSIAWAAMMGALLFARVTSVFARFDSHDHPGELMQELSIDSTYMVPTMVRLAREHSDFGHAGWQALRFLMVGGEVLDPETYGDLAGHLGDRLYAGYGMTEATCAAAGPSDLRDRPGTVGRATPLRQFMIADPGTESPVPIGDEGEVLVRSPDLFFGYLGEEPAGLWHRSGDVGRTDADGYLFITGRSGSVLNIGGNRVSTDEVTAAIREHPRVAQAIVIAEPDPVWTHRLHAFVVARDDQLERRSLEGWLRRNRLPAYKIPREFHFLDELPTTGSGKTSVASLRGLARGRGDS